MFEGTATHTATPTISAEAYTIPLLRPDAWLEEAAEGELAVDVYEAEGQFVIQAALAGVQPDHLSLAIHRDLLTIRGERAACAPHTNPAYLTRECYWGKFSRSILLPEQVDTGRATAMLKQSILTVTLPKRSERTEIVVDHIAD